MDSGTKEGFQALVNNTNTIIVVLIFIFFSQCSTCLHSREVNEKMDKLIEQTAPIEKQKK